jgi:hypothetical protein
MKTKDLQRAIFGFRSRLLDVKTEDLRQVFRKVQGCIRAAFFLTLGFATTVLAFGVLWAFIHAYWIWQPSAIGWVSSPQEAFSFGMFFVLIFTAGVSFLFGLVSFCRALCNANLVGQPKMRLCAKGCYWGAGVVNLVSYLLMAMSFAR